jgi:hypothetical protein
MGIPNTPHDPGSLSYFFSVNWGVYSKIFMYEETAKAEPFLNDIHLTRAK